MTIEETVRWLKIMRANLKNFPEICNGETANAPKKIEALSNAIEIVDACKPFYVINKEDCKKLEKVIGKSDQEIPYLMHKEMDMPISECQKAYGIAMEYLRSQAKVKG